MDDHSAVTVLLLEEEAIIATDLEFNLTRSGFDVACMLTSTAEARHWLTFNSPSVVILDVKLRDGPCHELAQTLHNRGIPFIVHSSLSRREADEENAFTQGIWLLKPSLPQDLAKAIAHSVGREAFQKRPVLKVKATGSRIVISRTRSGHVGAVA